MRDLILFASLLGILGATFRAPIVGVLAWIWIALMNPQREVYSFLSGAGLNFVVALATILAWAASKERKAAPANPTVLIWGLFVVWMCVTTFFALDPAHIDDLLDRNIKTAVLLFAVVCIANTKLRMHAVIWAIAVSLAYYSVRGGLLVLISGGSYKVAGPPGTMISDNNCLGLALVLLLPLLNYLRTTSGERLVRLALLGVMVLTFFAILGTYSRGALLAVAAMVALAAVRSRAGLLLVVAAGGLVAMLPHLMPADWFERMASIQTAGQDDSFASRVSAWRTSFHIATERVTGGGFRSTESAWVLHNFPTAGGLTRPLAAHSIYFQVLGDHGFIGLALFLGLIGTALLNTSMVLHRSRGRPELKWANQLARMLQVSIIAYMVGGAALSMAYYDGFLLILLLTAALHQTVKHPVIVATDAFAPKWKAGDVELPAASPPATRPNLS